MKINFSINGVKRYIEPDYVWWAKHWKKVAIVVGVLVLVFSLSGCAGMGGNEAYAALPPGWASHLEVSCSS